MTINITRILDKLIWLSVVIFLVLSMTISFALDENSRLGGVILLLVLAITFILYLVKNNGRIYFKWTKIHSYMLFFIIACFLSSLGADDPSIAFARTFDMVKVFLMLIVWLLCYPSSKDVDKLLKAYMWTNYVVCFYVLYMYGFNILDFILMTHARIDNSLLNANTLGLAAANAIFISIYYLLYDRFRLLYCLVMIPAVFMLLVSGSKKAIILIVLGAFILYLFRDYNNSDFVNKSIKLLVKIVGFFVFLALVLQLPFLEGIVNRFEALIAAFTNGGEVDHSSSVRLDLVNIGWNLFFKAPIFGVGINNPQLYTYFTYNYEGFYLHNNYLELLAGTGIIGFISYYWIYIFMGYMLIKHMNMKSKIYIMISTMFWIGLFLDIGRVTYETKTTYFVLLIYYLYINSLNNNNKKIEVDKNV